ETFPGMLVKMHLSYGKIEPVPADKSGEGGGGPFAGAHQAVRTFKDDSGADAAIATTTFSRYLQEQLEGIKDAGGKSKYPKAESLFELVGTAGKGMVAREGHVQTFSAMR